MFSWWTLTFYSIYFMLYQTPSSRCVKYVLKIFQTEIMKILEIACLKWKELNQNCSWKRAFLFNKSAPLFDKRAFEWPRRAGGVRIAWNNNLFLTLLIKEFFKPGHFLSVQSPDVSSFWHSPCTSVFSILFSFFNTLYLRNQHFHYRYEITWPTVDSSVTWFLFVW